jgi:hypothetical protein
MSSRHASIPKTHYPFDRQKGNKEKSQDGRGNAKGMSVSEDEQGRERERERENTKERKRENEGGREVESGIEGNEKCLDVLSFFPSGQARINCASQGLHTPLTVTLTLQHL